MAKSDETAADGLLRAVEEETSRAAFNSEMAAIDYKAALARARAPRRDAILEALDAGISREKVAAAAGVKFARMYQLIREKPGE